MSNFIVWLVAFMTTLAPPGRPQYIPEAQETKEEAVARYQAIAEDLQAVIMDPDEKVITSGSQARIRMSAILLSIMLHESGFRKDVDTGVGKHARGDGGKSWCLMQINIGSGRTTIWNHVAKRFARPGDPPDQLDTGWTGAELVQDRKACLRAGLHTIVGTACRNLPVTEWLRAYASGNCGSGSEASRNRMSTALRWFAEHRPTFTDQDITKALTPQAPEAPSPDPLILRVSRGE